MDSYAPCPCGSGKKVKFCCQPILDEMAKIERLQSNNQPRMALQLIDKVLKDHPHNGWLVTQRAMALLNDDANDSRYEEARDTLVAFLHHDQDHPLANALLALAVSEMEPMERSKKVIHRAFIKSMHAEPQLVAILASRLASEFLYTGHEMAARQHLAMVMRLGPEEERQRTLMTMLELDSDTDVPYPLRGAHALPQYEPSEENAAQFKKARRLYINGCFSEASDVLTKLVETDNESAVLWHMIGLMRAWDGNEATAAAAFHEAAKLYSTDEFKLAVELETIAQLLDRQQRENCIAARSRRYECEGTSRLLTRLDNEDHLYRLPPQQNTPPQLVATYQVLDRPLPTDDEIEGLTLDTVPHTVARVNIYDQTEESPTLAEVIGSEGERLDKAVELFEKAAGDLAKPAAPPEDAPEDFDVLEWYPKQDIQMGEYTFVPPKTPSAIVTRLRQEFADKRVNEMWMTMEQACLDGKSPEEAKGGDAVALTAAVMAFDAFHDTRGMILDRDALLGKLGLEPLALTEAGEDLDLNTLSTMQLLGLDLKSMTDAVFYKVMQRALVVKHAGLGYRVLSEFIENRPQVVSENEREAEQAFLTLAEICSRSLKHEEGLEWIEKGFQHAKSQSAAFESQLMWKMRELTFRARDLNDPALKDLLLELWNYYGGKLPAVRERLQEFVTQLEIDPPWDNAIVVAQAGAGGTILTAETEHSVQGEKKLYIPD